MIRLSLAVAATLTVSATQSAFAQDWVEYASRQDRFTITFPAQPVITETTYKTASGSVLPARLYQATSGGSRYSVLVADFTNIERIATEKARACPPGAETCAGGRGNGSATGAGYWKADLAGAVTNATWEFFSRPGAKPTYLGWNSADLAASLRANRQRDAAAGRATEGPHRQDLAVHHRAKQMPAAQSSTGEQKALLLGLVLAHSELVAERRGEPPILLLDEVAAHLDPTRRLALFSRLKGRGQVWMTATEAALFDGIGEASRFHVEPGRIMAA